MNEQKVPKGIWWIGAIIAAAALAAKYYYTVKKIRQGLAEGKTEEGKSKTIPATECVAANLSSQFSLKRGETALLKEEGLRIKFTEAALDQCEASSVLQRRDPAVVVTLEISQELGGVSEKCTLELSTANSREHPRCIITTDQLIGQYDIRLMGLKFPKATGDIPESNEYTANLVIFKA